LEGFNGTVLAYGQTSSGKTYTMLGGPNIEDPVSQGIIPRMVKTVFEKIENASEDIEFTVKISMIEIYMEKLKDLLDPTKSNLKVHEDKVKGIYISDVTESYVSEESEVYETMRAGNENRAIGVTDMNKQSSRSHSIFILTVSQRNNSDFSTKTGKLYLVDLAGSEKVGKTGAKGQTLDEAKTINKSLTALGLVINALTDGKSAHIPYRDSKLTRVL
jgi:kinesin family protein 5